LLLYSVDMKLIEKRNAIALRERGQSIKEIAKNLGVSKASVSMWVRDVELEVGLARLFVKEEKHG
jgi:transposase